ncbi:MYG1 family protein [Burkholderia multivorans]|uniref:MYG1 family protein n=1 Tax=Burkholderia multivorans TaxID=87883 RepID=UPI001C23EBF6|nr:MYG1 family protein [Burkholderia multivorans]MBU9200379.1 MYG1 family protein [Burkholderia multivorans]MDN8078496.1 MYG1 family protein [Burkholderia multivorans]
MKVICTHSGSHHADDALGVAVLHTLHPGATIVRSRDPAVWATSDALVDVGGEYDAVTNRFDHHQKGFSERRANGVRYAASGLVWKTYGAPYVSRVCPGLTELQAVAVAQEVDARLIQYADAVDVGDWAPGEPHFGLSGIVNSMNSTWQEGSDKDDERFAEAVAFVSLVLRNLVREILAELRAAEKVRAGRLLADGRILVLEEARLPFDPVVCKEMPKVLFVVYPESRGEQIQVRVVPEKLGTFDARADLPVEWAGLRDAELAKVTGVEDAVFCHTGLFICGARSQDGAIRLAELAVEALNLAS